jgi:hypothetical protein
VEFDKDIDAHMLVREGRREEGNEGDDWCHTYSHPSSLPPSLPLHRAVVTATSNLRAANYKIPGRHQGKERGREGRREGHEI